MEQVAELIKEIEEIQRTRDKIILSLVKEQTEYILELNQDQLLGYGVDSNSKKITPPYTAFTVDIKMLKGQEYNHVTLKDTGDFYDSFYIEYRDKEFEIKAKDPKTGSLKEKYGDPVLGLTEKNLKLLIEEIKPRLIETIKERIYEPAVN